MILAGIHFHRTNVCVSLIAYEVIELVLTYITGDSTSLHQAVRTPTTYWERGRACRNKIIE